MANVFIVLGHTMIGPSTVLGLPNHPALPAVGLGLAGFVKSNILIQSLPEAAEGAAVVFPSHK